MGWSENWGPVVYLVEYFEEIVNRPLSYGFGKMMEKGRPQRCCIVTSKNEKFGKQDDLSNEPKIGELRKNPLNYP